MKYPPSPGEHQIFCIVLIWYHLFPRVSGITFLTVGLITFIGNHRFAFKWLNKVTSSILGTFTRPANSADTTSHVKHSTAPEMFLDCYV